MFAITKPSAISGTCVIGQGSTKAEAWGDAYGPKPWTWAGTGSTHKDAICVEVTEDELNDMHEASANR
jgi:hypothetical protein